MTVVLCLVSAGLSSTGSVLAKLAFSPAGQSAASALLCPSDPASSSSCVQTVQWAYTVLLVASMLACNVLGISFLVKSMNALGTTAATTVISSLQFFLSGLYGRVLFGELVSPLWTAGIVITLVGVALITRATTAKDKVQ
ncbi:EamA domain-containing protein [Plasmodiophora brassicae]|uniref:EamA domain-containing protein n=1 Tax=Plasmodiophora brassicae TaxID=37360 RepID=A0A0G4J1P6_PLABS|nr:hypothetical protein PBRA_001855 [Plasmodiophora brassicae]SPR01288.1 unnamed protein product [Plasmodiophora brassicae]